MVSCANLVTVKCLEHCTFLQRRALLCRNPPPHYHNIPARLWVRGFRRKLSNDFILERNISLGGILLHVPSTRLSRIVLIFSDSL